MLHPPCPPIAAAQRGLSLIELMISVTIGLIIIAAIGYVYIASRQTYRLNDNIARMQENGRYAMEVIGRDVRMAGYWGCAGTTSEHPLNNTLNNKTDYAYRFDTPVEGNEAKSNGWVPDQGVSGINPVPGTDILTVRGVYGNGVTVLEHPGGNPPGSADLKVSKDSGLNEEDIVLVSDCSNAAVFQITNLNTSAGFDNVVHNTGVGTPGNATKALGKEYTGGEIQRIATFTYYIRPNPAGRPALYRIANGTSEELVENVENMQVTYGVDTDDDRKVDEYRTADTVADWKKVRAVRVRLLLVSPDDNLVSEPQTYRYLDTNGDALPDPVTATDKRLRYVFTGTFAMRNLLP